MDNWDELQAELQNYMDAHRGSLNELTEHLGLKHHQQVQQWIRGNVTPSYDTGMKLRKWLEDKLNESHE